MAGADRRVQVGIEESEFTAVAAALDDAFTGYPVPISFTADSLRAMAADDDLVPEACVLCRGGNGGLLAAGLAALHGDRGRIAAMGVRRDVRRKGLGSVLGKAMLAALAEAGAREVIVEALTTNTAALALYERDLGFARRRRLIGFIRGPGGEPVDPSRWERAMAAGDEPESWQLRRAVDAARTRTDLVDVPAVVPEQHPVTHLLRKSGFDEAPIDQYELGRSLRS